MAAAATPVTTPFGHDSTAAEVGVASYALDPDNAERLWDVSLELIA